MQPAVIVEGHPVHHRLPGLFSGRKFPAMRADRFSRPRELYVGALSQQLPFPFIDERMPRSLRACRNSWLQYRLPLSLWNVNPGGGGGAPWPSRP